MTDWESGGGLSPGGSLDVERARGARQWALGIERGIALTVIQPKVRQARDLSLRPRDGTRGAIRQPERILTGELANETADIRRGCGSSCAPTPPGFPRSVQAKSPLVPAQQGVSSKDHECREALGPDPVQANPEETLKTAGPKPRVPPSGYHRELLAK